MNEENLSFKEKFTIVKHIFLKKKLTRFLNMLIPLREIDCLLSIDIHFYFHKNINNF